MSQAIVGSGPQQFQKDTTIGGLKLGCLSNVTAALSNTTLQPQDNGSVFILNPGVTAELPPLASVPVGAVYHFRTSSTGANRLVKGSGAEQIILGTGQGNTAALRDGETLSVVSGGSGWISVGGVAGLENTAGFGASLVGNGWQKLPSGLIVQWGVVAGANLGNTLTFPLAFPNNCFSMTASGISATPTTNSARIISKSSFQIFNGSADTTQWMAVGN